MTHRQLAWFLTGLFSQRVLRAPMPNWAWHRSLRAAGIRRVVRDRTQVPSPPPIVPCPKLILSKLLGAERVAAPHVTRLQTRREPACALCRSAMRKGIRNDIALGLAL